MVRHDENGICCTLEQEDMLLRATSLLKHDWYGPNLSPWPEASCAGWQYADACNKC
jgi:hypothetical protein